MPIISPQRVVRRAAATYYVRKDGSDSNNGLENTAAGAFATIEAALNLLKSIVGNGQAVEILLWDSTIASPHLLPSDTNDFRDYSKITIKTNPAVENDCYVQVDVNNFGGFNELELIDVSLIEGLFGGVLTVSETAKFFMQGCVIDDPLAIVLTDGTRGDINASSFGTTYAAGDGAFLVRRGAYLKYRSTNLNGATVVQATAAFFLCQEGGEVECAEILNGLAGEVANVQTGSKVRLPAGSDVNFSFDPSSEVIVGSQVYNYDNSDSGSSATNYKDAVDEALSSSSAPLNALNSVVETLSGPKTLNDSSATYQILTNPSSVIALVNISSSTSVDKLFVIKLDSSSSRNITVDRTGINFDIQPGEYKTIIKTTAGLIVLEGSGGGGGGGV